MESQSKIALSLGLTEFYLSKDGPECANFENLENLPVLNKYMYVEVVISAIHFGHHQANSISVGHVPNFFCVVVLRKQRGSAFTFDLGTSLTVCVKNVELSHFPCQLFHSR